MVCDGMRCALDTLSWHGIVISQAARWLAGASDTEYVLAQSRLQAAMASSKQEQAQAQEQQPGQEEDEVIEGLVCTRSR